jgi:hypothetical protein
MLRYAQDNQLVNVAMCLSRGCSPDYQDGALLAIAVYLNRYKLLKLVLKYKPSKGVKKAIDLATLAGDDRALQLLNEYAAKYPERLTSD